MEIIFVHLHFRSAHTCSTVKFKNIFLKFCVQLQTERFIIVEIFFAHKNPLQLRNLTNKNKM